MADLTTYSTDDRTARLALNRPEQRNALSLDLLTELNVRLDEIRRDTNISVVVLTGEGKSFCAGMDLKAVLHEPGAPRKLLDAIAEFTISLRTLPAVVIARVNGAAIGGGCGIAATCDISVTHPEAKLGFPEVDLGVCPAVVAPWLVQAVGAGCARRILMQGGTLSGLRAHEFGIISECVPSEQLDRRVDEIAAHLAEAGVQALRATKRLLSEMESDIYEQVRRGAAVSAEVIAGTEAQERLAQIYGTERAR